MPQYLIASYFADDYDPSTDPEASFEAVHALHREMAAAGVRKFACGLSPKTVTLQAQPDGEVLVTDGPYIEAKEHVGGVLIVETTDRDEVLAWARNATNAFPRATVEVREVFFVPASKQA